MWVILGLIAWGLGATLALLLLYAHGENEEEFRKANRSGSTETDHA